MKENVIIGKETGYPLKGILAMPDNLFQKVPAVVLVHGSGPSDKMKPFLRTNRSAT